MLAETKTARQCDDVSAEQVLRSNVCADRARHGHLVLCVLDEWGRQMRSGQRYDRQLNTKCTAAAAGAHEEHQDAGKGEKSAAGAEAQHHCREHQAEARPRSVARDLPQDLHLQHRPWVGALDEELAKVDEHVGVVFGCLVDNVKNLCRAGLRS